MPAPQAAQAAHTHLVLIPSYNTGKKLFETIGERYQGRNGGYTRITKLDYRMGDGAPLAAVELVGAEPPPAGPAKGAKADKKKEQVAAAR